MTPAYYLYKYPYKLGWYTAKLFNRNREIVFYCADPLDFEMFLPIKKFLPKIGIIAKNKKTRHYLKEKGIEFLRMPVFPKTVIMTRHSPHKFPVDQIKKIGFNHGLYQFKSWTASINFNRFDVFFLSSEEHVKKAESRGITTAKAIGYPKLDNAFNGTYDKKYLDNLRDECKIDKTKKTIMFSATWNVSNLSALDRWIDRVEELTEKYNVLVTVHTWTEKSKKDKLKSIKDVIYLENKFDATPYIMISDVFIGDSSSIIGEACALDKPLITFRLPESKRSVPEIMTMIKNISIQINTFDEINDAILRSLNTPNEKRKERNEANKIMFLALDGMAGKRASEEIIKLLEK